MELNDIPIMALQNHRSSELYERTMEQFECLYEEGQESTRIMAVAIHPYRRGVPHRAKHYQRIFESLSQKPEVLFRTGDPIMDWHHSVR